MSKGENLAKQWMAHRAVLVEILDKIEDKDLDFRPWEQAMTLKELVLHMITSGNMFVATARAGEFTAPGDKPEANSAEELRKVVHSYTDKNYEDIKGMSDEALDHPVISERIFANPTPAKVWLAAMKEHEIHHKGQLFVYARMTGIQEMPGWIKRG